jgi:hypothetical protein
MTQLLPRTFALNLLLAGSLFLVLTAEAQAERLESNSYVIQFGNFNMGSGEQDSTSYSMTQTLGQIGAGPYQSATKFLGAGFQYIYTIHYFRFAISQLFIDLGELLPGVHNSDSNVLTIDTKGAGGYIVYAYETHPLRHSDNVTILPDTTCDAGSCSELTAQPWTNQLIPGFGFNVSGAQVAPDFLSSDHFRQFADNSLGEPMQPIMSSPYVAFQNQATVTYKAGATGAEVAGNYRTEVIYIAVPGY